MLAQQWGWLVVLSILWGGSFFFVGVAVQDVPTLTLVLCRVGLAALVLLAVVWFRKQPLPGSMWQWMPFVVMALLNNIFPFSLMVLGQSEIASGLASVLNATTPLWAVMLAHVFTADEKLSVGRVAGVVLGVVGVSILIGPAVFNGETASVFGMVCVLGGAMSYGFAGVWGRRLRTTPPLVSATCQLICSSLLLLPVALSIDQPWNLPVPSATVLLALAGLAVFSTAVAYLVFYHILTVSGSTNVMLVTLLIPVSSILLGAAFLNEVLLPQHFAGAGIIAAALILFDGRLPAFLVRSIRSWRHQAG